MILKAPPQKVHFAMQIIYSTIWDFGEVSFVEIAMLGAWAPILPVRAWGVRFAHATRLWQPELSDNYRSS